LDARTDERVTAEIVWRDVGPALRAFVHQRIADREAADDVVGDLMLRIHQHVSSLNDQEKVTSWVFRMARNAITDHYRRSARRRARLHGEPEPDTPATDETWIDDQGALRSELSACVLPMLQALPAEYRRALQLTDFEGRTQAEAAQIEAISISGMKSRVQRGRRRFASLLDACCLITLDARRRPMDYARRPDGQCPCCDDDERRY
jgi:RNA polymerase sigma-70 factor (ECF subfamily)